MKSIRATIIYNPVSGRNLFRERKVWKMIRLLGERGVVEDAAATYGPETGASLAREAVGSGSEVIICHGGDGTLNEVLQGIAGSSAAKHITPVMNQTMMGILRPATAK